MGRTEDRRQLWKVFAEIMAWIAGTTWLCIASVPYDLWWRCVAASPWLWVGLKLEQLRALAHRLR